MCLVFVFMKNMCLVLITFSLYFVVVFCYLWGTNDVGFSEKHIFVSWSGPGMEIWGIQTIHGHIFSVRSFLEGSRELGMA